MRGPWLALALTLAGCASLPASRTASVAGRTVELAVAGTGRPVIVFETGLGADMSTWSKVFPGAAALSTAFAYSRPGYGRSEVADTPRTGRVIVEELRAVLRSEGLAPPYVLVGHSLGGLYMQLFARTHPDEVAGLVLVDSTHPTEWRGANPLENRDDCWSFVVSLYMTGTRGRELEAAMATGQDVLGAPLFTGKPVMVLAATGGGNRHRAVDDKRRDLWELHPGSTFVWVESGHGIQKEQPAAVLAAIRLVVDEIRRKEAADPGPR